MEEEKNVVNEVVGDSAQPNETSQQITFDNEKAFMDRVKREAKKQQQEFIKSLGFEKDDDLKAVIQKQKDLEESSKTEFEKLQEQLQLKTEYINQVNQNLKLSEVKSEALNAGIKPERLNYALKLLDVNNIEFVDGAINKEQLNNSINSLLTDFPELKGLSGTPKGGQDFNSSTTPDLLNMDIIKSMSPQEMEKRLPEVLKFLSKK